MRINSLLAGGRKRLASEADDESQRGTGEEKMIENITHESFQSIVGDSVDLRAGEVDFQAVVKSVNLLRENPGQGRQPFSVVLQSQDIESHGQQTYHLSHPDLGELELFLVPIGLDEEGILYEIIFN